MPSGAKTVEGVERARAHEADKSEEAYLGDRVVVKGAKAFASLEPFRGRQPQRERYDR